MATEVSTSLYEDGREAMIEVIGSLDVEDLGGDSDGRSDNAQWKQCRVPLRRSGVDEMGYLDDL